MEDADRTRGHLGRRPGQGRAVLHRGARPSGEDQRRIRSWRALADRGVARGAERGPVGAAPDRCRARAFREASRELGRPVLSLHTDDCAAEAERLKAKGVVFVKEPGRMAYGGLDAVFADSPTPAATCSTSTRTERRNRHAAHPHAAHPPTQPLIMGLTDPHTGRRSRDRFGLDRITGTSHRTDFAAPVASPVRVRR
jgi:hypothetical protein